MSILSGFKSFERYLLTDTGYQLVSQVTQARDVKFQDGKTAQDKLGGMDGIATTLSAVNSATSTSMVASATAVKEAYNTLNSNLTQKVDASALGTQTIMLLTGTTLTITTK